MNGRGNNNKKLGFYAQSVRVKWKRKTPPPPAPNTHTHINKAKVFSEGLTTTKLPLVGSLKFF